MKRSEMIIDIAIELMSRLPEWEKQERLNFAEEILQCVEVNGMAPPFYDKTQDNNGEKIIIPAREWEDENND